MKDIAARDHGPEHSPEAGKAYLPCGHFLHDQERVRKDPDFCGESEDPGQPRPLGGAPHKASYVTFRECIVYVVVPRLSKNKRRGPISVR